MIDDLVLVMREYIDKVNRCCDELLLSLNESEGIDLQTKQDFFHYQRNNFKFVFTENNYTFIVHGIGCIAFNDGVYLEWDFGYRSRWCGIEPWKLAITLEKNQYRQTEFYNGRYIADLCEQLVENKVMFKKYNQYYFNINEFETYKPKFPKEFDHLLIECRNNKWILLRDKLVDRFIRKSVMVQKKLEKSSEIYILTFLKENEHIYKVYYSDISYPESAVKIMSDNILRILSNG